MRQASLIKANISSYSNIYKIISKNKYYLHIQYIYIKVIEVTSTINRIINIEKETNGKQICITKLQQHETKAIYQKKRSFKSYVC